MYCQFLVLFLTNLAHTVDWEFFGRKIFRRLNFCLAGFVFVAMTTWQYKLTPFIHQRKNFVGLVFVLEGDHRKFFPDENFPIYSNCQFLVCSHTSKWRVLAYHSDTSSHGPGGQVLAEVCSHHSVVAVSLHHPAPDDTMFARLQVAPFCRRKGEKGERDINIDEVWLSRASGVMSGGVTEIILCAYSLKTHSSFYNSWTKHDMEIKFTSINFSRRVAEGSRIHGCKAWVANL